MSRSEVASALRVTPGLPVSGIVFAVVMGLIGGLSPTWRAARLQVVPALR
jgi:ABC-type lipoprotein release transport system permease subunit